MSLALLVFIPVGFLCLSHIYRQLVFFYYVNAVLFIFAIQYMNIILYNIMDLFNLFFILILFSKFDNGRSPCQFAIIVGGQFCWVAKGNTRLYRFYPQVVSLVIN